jgi:hypothetical protein
MYDYDRRTAAVVDMDLAKTYADAWSNDLIGRLAPRFIPPAKLGEVLRGQWFDLVGVHARSLEWRSSQWMTPASWAAQMELVCPEYNMFHAGKVGAWLSLLPGVEVQPAREHSVCLYLRGSPEDLAKVEWQAKKVIHADVVDMQVDGTLRLWWD